MRRSATLAVLSVFVLLLGSGSARASSWWDYLEALSGPGPFKGYNHYFANIYCAGQEKALRIAKDDPAEIDTVKIAEGLKPGLFGRATNGSIITGQTEPCFYFDFSSLSAEADARFPPVGAKFYEVGLEYRLLNSLDIGAGFGGIHFTAEPANQPTVTTNALMLTPVRLTITPLFALRELRRQPWAGIVKVYFRQSLLVGTLDGSNFGAPAGVFHEESEFVRSFGVVLDLTRVVRF